MAWMLLLGWLGCCCYRIGIDGLDAMFELDVFELLLLWIELDVFELLLLWIVVALLL